mmetsp:Transcript_23121/g.58085  ORF Transcript_23121/g.58085 Transcript_23121/m.58085 type:complete len:502 (-) Transcript_23121:189-1694(-)|eukprot:jgi/Tetstr1/422680/TSEL_013478.t1
MASKVTLQVKQSGAEGRKLAVELALADSVADLKDALAGPSGIPAGEQRLVYKGQVLRDERTLESYGLAADHVLHLVRGRPVGGSSGAAPPAAAPPQSTSAPMGGAPRDGLFGSLGGADPLGGDAGMASLMNNPMMQSMLDNPEMLRSIFQSNPAIRDLMERNPELAQMLNNPAVLRESMQMASNPALMREHMRNADRAMSNIESHPEGFNMLRRMYENVQEPLMNATTTAAENTPGTGAAAGAGANPFASLFSTAPTGGANAAAPNSGGAAPNAAPLPNPWSAGGGGGGGAGGGGAAPAGAPGANPFGSLPGLGGLGGGLPGMGGSPEEMEAMASMMQNPAMQSMMQQMMSSPGMMDSLINSNPQLRSMADANPAVRDMLSNPEMVQRMMDPANLQAIMQMQTAMNQLNQGGFGSAFGLPGSGMDGLSGGGGDMGSMLSAMMGGGGGGGGAPAVADPETHFASQIQTLADMGFTDRQANIRALQATAGNVNAAVERLLSGL